MPASSDTMSHAGYARLGSIDEGKRNLASKTGLFAAFKYTSNGSTRESGFYEQVF